MLFDNHKIIIDLGKNHQWMLNENLKALWLLANCNSLKVQHHNILFDYNVENDNFTVDEAEVITLTEWLILRSIVLGQIGLMTDVTKMHWEKSITCVESL